MPYCICIRVVERWSDGRDGDAGAGADKEQIFYIHAWCMGKNIYLREWPAEDGSSFSQAGNF